MKKLTIATYTTPSGGRLNIVSRSDKEQKEYFFSKSTLHNDEEISEKVAEEIFYSKSTLFSGSFTLTI